MEWSHEALTQRVYEILKNDLLSVGEDFTPHSNLIEAGLDSLAVTQLMLAIEESTGIFLDASLLTEETLACAERLAACVHAQLPR
jgi:acyl carrier protein